MHVGAALRMFRLEAGVSLRALARHIGVSSAYLSRVETGRDPAPTAERLQAIAEVLELPPEILVELASQTGAALASYTARVPAASAFFLEVARRDLDAGQISRLRELMEAEFPAGGLAEPSSLVDLVGQRVVVGMSTTSMRKVIEVGAACCAGGDGDAARDIAARILAREAEHPTLLGKGFAVPHVSLPEGTTRASLITLRKPIACDSPDGAPIEVVVVLVSKSGGRDHLETLARIARIASRNVVAELRAAENRRQILSIIRRMERQ